MASGGDLPRRIKSCNHCRTRRVACVEGEDDQCCLRCATKGLQCVTDNKAPAGPRVNNDASELRSQLTRFETLLDAMKQQAARQEANSTSSTPPSASTSRQTLDSPAPSESIEVLDLVGALNGLCFRADGVTSGPKGKLTESELIAEAKAMLSQEDHDSVTHLPPGGFVYQPLPPQATLRDLIAALPDEYETMWLLEGVMMTRWTKGLNGLFFPTWPLKVREFFRSDFVPHPHPHELAELFGCLAIASSVMQTGLEYEHQPEQRQSWQQRVDRYAELLQRALAIGKHIEEPSLASARSLCLLAELYLSCSSSTSRLARGLALLPVAFAAINQLGFHASESEFEGHETPQEQYERRALVCTLLRLDWQTNLAVGRRALTDPRTWPIDTPVEPRDEDLPPKARHSPFRMTPILIHSLRSCFRLVQLQQEIVADLYGGTAVDYAAVRRYAVQIDALLGEVWLPGWRLTDDANGNRVFVSQKAGQIVPFDERIARDHVIPKVLRLLLTLHRPFVHPEANVYGTAVDYAWHQSVLLGACRDFLPLWQEIYNMVGAFSAINSTCFDAIIGICILIFANPASPDASKHRHELSTSISSMLNSPAAPAVVHKLGRITSYLLDKPKIRKAEQLVQPHASQEERKRVKTGRMGNGYEVASFAPQQAVATSPEGFQFSFQPANAPALQTSLPSTGHTSDSGDVLVHKSAFATVSKAVQTSRPASLQVQAPPRRMVMIHPTVSADGPAPHLPLPNHPSFAYPMGVHGLHAGYAGHAADGRVDSFGSPASRDDYVSETLDPRLLSATNDDFGAYAYLDRLYPPKNAGSGSPQDTRSVIRDTSDTQQFGSWLRKLPTE